MPSLSSLIDGIAGLPPGLLLALVFLLPAAEAGILIGVFVPGETAVLLGGVAAQSGALPLWAVIAAAILGAVLGDQVGYLLGRRYGESLLARVPSFLWRPESIQHSLAVVERRGAAAVLVGRWAAALRAFVPGIAGVSGMGRRSFTLANAAGGATWATAIALAGYAAGASYRDIEAKFGRVGEGVTAVVVVLIVLLVAVRHVRSRRPADPGVEPPVTDGGPGEQPGRV